MILKCVILKFGKTQKPNFMSEILRVSLTSLNSRETQGDVLLNVDNIETLFTSNSKTYIDYNFKGSTRRLGVTQTEASLVTSIGDYTAGRTMTITTLTRNGLKLEGDRLVNIDDLIWGDSIDEDADTFRLLMKDATYECSGSPATFLSSANQAIATGSAFVGAYATGSRPSASAQTTGYFYFDTSKGYVLWSNGSDWVNATGTIE